MGKSRTTGLSALCSVKAPKRAMCLWSLREGAERRLRWTCARTFSMRSQEGRRLRRRAQDNLKTLAMVFAIEMSSRLRREVSLDEVLA